MRKRFAIIGLDEPLAKRAKSAIQAVDWDALAMLYPTVPPVEFDTALRVESPSIAGRMLDVDGVVYYSYFEGVDKERLALALAPTPTFPSVRAAQPLDDKLAALVLSLRADPLGARAPGRRVVRDRALCAPLSPEEREVVARHPGYVVKANNAHCGHGKWRTEEFLAQFPADETHLVSGPIYVEPFVVGESVRVLLVGNRAWQLHYKSEDWRKNVRSTVWPISLDRDLLARARQIAGGLGLTVAGIDFILPETGDPVLLEVNAYPGLGDAPGAEDAFVDLLSQWAASICRSVDKQLES
jgi:hypothetical protein